MTVHDDVGALKEAERDLAEAKVELGKAEKDIEKAEAELKRAEDRPEFKVEVIHNGVSRPFEVHRDELVKVLLEKAIREFGSVGEAHRQSLYKDGKPLDDNLSLHAAGVRPGDKLLLRTNEVKGGS